MKSGRARIALAYLGFLAAGAALAPWLALRDPAAQPDGLVLRDLPPLAQVDEIRLRGDRIQLASEVRAGADGAIEYRRGERWTRIEAGELASPDPRVWHGRRTYLLGTDAFGRDLLSRVIHGARISLLVGFLGAAIAVALGGAIGLAAGLSGGIVDALLMRLTDVALSVPRLFLLLLIVALYGPSLAMTILVLGCTTWMAAARAVRTEVLTLRERDYVRSAVAAGASRVRVACAHLLPAIAGTLLIEATLRVGQTILLEASLSFLGLGVPQPTPSWGNLIADGRDALTTAWWIAAAPGVAVVVTVLAVGVVGDALRERSGPLSIRPAS